ncbi:MAG: hypothetical protein IAF02_28085, partial [Anaerolineae bacterium]|nr:hypothetical protein [Anaerolineae bacterium]
MIQLSIVMVVGVGGLLFLWQIPALGLLLTMLGGIMVPFTGPSGINVAVLGFAALLGIWLLDMVVYQKKITLVSSRPIRPLLFFVFVAILSFIVGQLPWFFFVKPAPMYAQLGGLMIFILSAGAFLLVAHQVRDIRWLQWMTWSFIALAGLHIAGWIIP